MITNKKDQQQLRRRHLWLIWRKRG